MEHACWLPLLLVLYIVTWSSATFLVTDNDKEQEITHRGDIPEFPTLDDSDGKEDDKDDSKPFLTLDWDIYDEGDDDDEDEDDEDFDDDNGFDLEDEDAEDVDEDEGEDENDGDEDEIYDEEWKVDVRQNEADNRRRHMNWFDRIKKQQTRFWPSHMRTFDFEDLGMDPFININLGINVDFREDEKWWKGPNVCKRVEESEESGEEVEQMTKVSIARHHMVTATVCDDTGTVYKCTTDMNILNNKKTITTIYECCYGYQRQDKKKGCTKKIQLEDLLETLDSLETTDMIEALEGVSLITFLEEGNYTIFAPLESILEDIKPVQNSMSNVIVVTPDLIEMAKDVEETISTHIVQGFVRTTNLQDEQLLPTLSSGDNIRINIYETPKRMVTANCQPVLSSDNMATNGVVHLIKAPMAPVKHTMAKIIDSHPNLTTFKKVIKRTGLLPLLKRDGQYTLLAPSDEAFSELDPYIKDKLLAGGHCIEDVIKNHLLPNVICSSILEGNLFAINLLNNYLNVTRDGTSLFVEEALVTRADLMATNGVIHVIDRVLIPKEVLTLPELASELGADTMLDLIAEAQMSDELVKLEDFTVFIPSEAAFKKLSESQHSSLKDDVTKLRQVLRYHILNSTEKFEDLDDDRSYATAEPGQHLQIQAHNKFPFFRKTEKMVECAEIEKSDVGCCGGVVHMIDKVLIPPPGDILSTLEADNNFSKLVKMLKQTDLTEKLHNHESLTFFAPSNKALDAMSSEAMDYLRGNPDKLQAFLEHHIAKDSICCSGVDGGIFMSRTKPTLDGSVILPERQGKKVSVNKVPVVECDTMATNGIIHRIDDIIPEAVNRYIIPFLRKNHQNKESFHGHFDDMTDNLQTYMDNLLNHLFDEHSHNKKADKYRGMDRFHNRDFLSHPFFTDNSEFNPWQVPNRPRLPHRKPTHIHVGDIDHAKDEAKSEDIVPSSRGRHYTSPKGGRFIPKPVTGGRRNIGALSGRRHHWTRPHPGPHARRRGGHRRRQRGHKRQGRDGQDSSD